MGGLDKAGCTVLLYHRWGNHFKALTQASLGTPKQFRVGLRQTHNWEKYFACFWILLPVCWYPFALQSKCQLGVCFWASDGSKATLGPGCRQVVWPKHHPQVPAVTCLTWAPDDVWGVSAVWKATFPKYPCVLSWGKPAPWRDTSSEGTLPRETGTETLPCELCFLSSGLSCRCLLYMSERSWNEFLHPGVVSLPSGPVCQTVWWSCLTSQRTFMPHQSLFLTSLTLLQKTYAQGDCTGGQNCQWITDIQTFESDILTSSTSRHFSVGYIALTFRKLMLA